MAVRTWSTRFRWTTVMAPLLLMGVITRLILDIALCPFGILELLLALWCVWTGFVFRRVGWWAIQLAAVLVACALGEACLTYQRAGKQPQHQSLAEPPVPYHQQSDLLGTVPVPKGRTRYLLRVNSQTFIDIVYTIDEQGLRRTPSADSSAATETIVFLGCSFTYGEGVEDEETQPAQVAARVPRAKVLNFGYSGYGPHQMLANLESGRVETLCPTPPRRVIFQMIPDQVRRVRGWVNYHPHAPRYVLRDGRVRRAGNLDDSWWWRVVKRDLWKSKIFHRIIAPRQVGQADMDLAVALVRQSAEEVSRRSPGCEFHVLFWNHPDEKLAVPVRRMLEEAGIHLHSVEEEIPELLSTSTKYRIKHDGHPTAETNRLLADYVCREILGEP
jgi:hypothetical protein